VLELLEGRVHRAGACPPRAIAAALELLNDLVAVRGLLGEEDQDRSADVAARRPAARAEGLAEASGTREAGAEVGRVEGRPAPAMTAPGTLLDVITDVVVEACGGVVMSPRALVVRSGVGVFSGHVGSLHCG